MNRLRQEDGFTLPELLVGAMLMVIVMSGTLLVLDNFTTMGARTDRKADLQDSARAATRQVSRALRNLAASPDRPGVVERAGPYDLVFRLVDRPRADAGSNTRNLRRVRYCLDASAPNGGRLIEQTQRWNSTAAPAVPAGTDCPASGYSGDPRLIADRVTNRADGRERDLFTYGQTAGQISSIKLNLFLNDPKGQQREVSLQTGVFLRNQNRSPAAQFTATPVGVRHLLLNGSGSTDPEGQPLDYHWYVDGVEVGRGMLFDYYAPTAGTRSVRLEVFDSGGLVGAAPAQTVVVQ